MTFYDHAPDSVGPPLRFVGEWGGDYKSIRNWMMPTPLVPHHPDPNVNTRGGGKVSYWSKDEFGGIFAPLMSTPGNILPPLQETLGESMPYPHKFRNECLHYLVYEFHKPKRENLTGYATAPLVACSK